MRGERGVQPDEVRQMVRCVQLYYRAQRHQNEIARELGLSSSKVSRLLKRAFAEGLVRVEIELPKRPRLEAAAKRDATSLGLAGGTAWSMRKVMRL